ncbi:hypothetical protein T8S45_01665 [Blastomonas marina]|uniref:hypothetical protein n=1 Tax=Blastomonas marina TaxID=1867408 RepID=UPI002AC96DEF|nr:hypothetical protein [Blastomonas marina]WPZ04265.1 hypothetical protein T8S45_01665 [Blastomonas marina]
MQYQIAALHQYRTDSRTEQEQPNLVLGHARVRTVYDRAPVLDPHCQLAGDVEPEAPLLGPEIRGDGKRIGFVPRLDAAFAHHHIGLRSGSQRCEIGQGNIAGNGKPERFARIGYWLARQDGLKSSLLDIAA